MFPKLSDIKPSEDIPTVPHTPSSKRMKAVSIETKPTCFHCDTILQEIIVSKNRWVCKYCKDKE